MVKIKPFVSPSKGLCGETTVIESGLWGTATWLHPAPPLSFPKFQDDRDQCMSMSGSWSFQQTRNPSCSLRGWFPRRTTSAFLTSPKFTIKPGMSCTHTARSASTSLPRQRAGAHALPPACAPEGTSGLLLGVYFREVGLPALPVPAGALHLGGQISHHIHFAATPR